MSLSRVTRQALQVLALLVLAVLLAPTVYWHTRPMLRLYVWDGYFSPKTLYEFEIKYQVRLKVTTYATNEELLARLKVSWDEFDVIMPSNYMVDQMRRYHLLQRLDEASVPNIRNLAAASLNGNVVPPGEEYYGVPYLGNYAGIGYNKRRVSNPPASWAQFFSMPTATIYGARLAVLDEPRETIGLALLALGHSPNSRNPQELDQVRQMLEDQVAVARPTFVRWEGKDLLLARKISLLATWSPEVALAEGTDADIGYVMPSDGSILTVDTLAVPASSSQQDLAMKFINFVLQPDVASAVTEFSGYTNSLRRDLAPIPADLSKTPSYALPPAGKSFVLTDVGDAQYLYDTIWAEYRTQRGVE
jgi:spermidine/putrescine transport system substrate-binding protein